MSILIIDPKAKQQAAETYEAEVVEAQRTGGPWPVMPPLSKEEQEFSMGMASTETVYRHFHKLGGGMSPESVKSLDESPIPLDESFPSRANFDTESAPFVLKEGK